MANTTKPETAALKIKFIEESGLQRNSSPVKKVIGVLLLYLPLVFWAFVTIFPFWYMLVLSTKDRSSIFNFPPPMAMTGNFIQGFIDNYHSLMAQIPFWRNLWNSVYIAVMQTFFSALFAAMAGFSFAIYRFKGRKPLYAFIIFMMSVPQVISFLPLFLIVRDLGWLDKARAIWVPALASVTGLFMITNYIRDNIPIEFIESARLDGSSEVGIFRRIILPLIAPILGSYAIISFIASWNNYFQAMLVLRSSESYTIPVALSMMLRMSSIPPGTYMVGILIAVFPLLIVFMLFSRFILQKVTESAPKD